MNKIQKAYEQGFRVRKKEWDKKEWVKKYSETVSIDESENIWGDSWSFVKFPEKWEIWHEDQLQTDTIVQSVQSDLQARSERGITKYGTTLDRTDLSQKEWLQHAYEEALDLALYLKKLINKHE